jgi:hypothetical protein
MTPYDSNPYQSGKEGIKIPIEDIRLVLNNICPVCGGTLQEFSLPYLPSRGLVCIDECKSLFGILEHPSFTAHQSWSDRFLQDEETGIVYEVTWEGFKHWKIIRKKDAE